VSPCSSCGGWPREVAVPAGETVQLDSLWSLNAQSGIFAKSLQVPVSEAGFRQTANTNHMCATLLEKLFPWTLGGWRGREIPVLTSPLEPFILSPWKFCGPGIPSSEGEAACTSAGQETHVLGHIQVYVGSNDHSDPKRRWSPPSV
jgi:hypothetical protein